MGNTDRTRAADGSAGDTNYGLVGQAYSACRQAEPLIAQRIVHALGKARTVLNVGAGAGSYEPVDRDVTAVEPSASMRAQRPGSLSPAVDAIAEVFKLLGDPTRVRLVDALTHGERCVCDLAKLVGLSESAVSHQLRLLRAAHLVRVRRAGRLAFYSLDDHHVVGLVHDTRKHVEEHE